MFNVPYVHAAKHAFDGLADAAFVDFLNFMLNSSRISWSTATPKKKFQKSSVPQLRPFTCYK
jgi:hypothetical protein